MINILSKKYSLLKYVATSLSKNLANLLFKNNI